MKRKYIQPTIAAAFALAFAGTQTSCQTAAGTGAGLGAAVGALGTAIFTNEEDTNKRRQKIAKGAIIGAGVGGVAGAVADAKAKPYQPYPTQGGDYGYTNGQQQRPVNPNYRQPQQQQQQDSRYNQSYPQQGNYPPPRPTVTQQYPVGTATQTPGVVISPYAPNYKIDVRGFQSGELVVDPKTERVFRIP